MKKEMSMWSISKFMYSAETVPLRLLALSGWTTSLTLLTVLVRGYTATLSLQNVISDIPVSFTRQVEWSGLFKIIQVLGQNIQKIFYFL